LIIGCSIGLVPACSRASRGKQSRVEELRNLAPQSLQLRRASDGAKQVLGGNDAHRRLLFLFVLNLHVTTQ
jgi:hypothetical protein